MLNQRHNGFNELEPSDSHYQCVCDHYASAKTKQNTFPFVPITQNNMTRW